MTGPVINHERLKQRRAEGSRGGAGWKPKEGENKVRVLPPGSRFLTAWDQMEDVAVGFEMHYFGQGPGTEVSRCPKDLKLPCPACDAYWANRESADPGLKEMVRQIKSTRVYLMNVIDINNVGAGIQHWGSNYTCWDRIIEMVANPSYGNVLDPANGVNFLINLTPKNRSRTGFPQYDVQPERDGGPAGPVYRTTVMNVLSAIPDWQGRLDQLELQITAMKSADEIRGLLEALRIPLVAGQTTRLSRPIAPPAGVVAAAAPIAAATAVAPAPVAAPVAAAPVPVAVAAAVPAAVPAAAPVAAATPSATAGFQTAAPAASSFHYDPGPQYVPKISDAERPAGAPRCFGDYNASVHKCNHPCPVRGSCQMKMLGIA